MHSASAIPSPSRPLRLTVTRVVKLMRGGAVLRCSYSPAVWELDNGWEVSASVACKVITSPGIAGMGDSLLDAELSQTFRFKN